MLLKDTDHPCRWRNSPPPSQLDNTSILTRSTSTIAETGTDVLHLLEHFYEDDIPTETNLASFPLQLLSNYTSTQSPFFGPGGLLGLGPSSTLLSALVQSGKIASRSFGLYLGTAYPPAGGPTNGSLTLGGYDGARFQHPVQSFPLDTSDSAGSALKINVPQITVSNTTSPSIAILKGSTTAFDAYLSTSQYEMTLPASISAALAQALNATVSGNTLLISDTVAANLTISLPNNLTLTFPSTILTSNPIAFSESGPYILGSSFLSIVYFAVSYDSLTPTFFLAPAVQDATFVSPKPLCANTIPTPQSAAHISFFVRNGLIGLVIGASVGGSALVLLMFAMLRSWGKWRERKRVVRFMNLKKQEGGGEELELGNVDTNTLTLTMKAGQVRVVEKLEREREWDAATEAEPDSEPAIYFDPPPRRATVAVDRKSRKVLKGILKVTEPQK
jgi:Eukaryotic aspartyl protease